MARSLKMAFILCSDHSFTVFWSRFGLTFVQGKVNPADNRSWLSFQKYTPLIHVIKVELCGDIVTRTIFCEISS